MDDIIIGDLGMSLDIVGGNLSFLILSLVLSVWNISLLLILSWCKKFWECFIIGLLFWWNWVLQGKFRITTLSSRWDFFNLILLFTCTLWIRAVFRKMCVCCIINLFMLAWVYLMGETLCGKWRIMPWNLCVCIEAFLLIMPMQNYLLVRNIRKEDIICLSLC